MHQQALTVVAVVRDGRGPALDVLLRDTRKAMQRALHGVSSLHFARFVVLPPTEAGGAHSLAIETNFDGELEPHLDELWQHVGHLLKPCLSHCRDWNGSDDAEAFQRFVSVNSERARAYYVAHPGLTVPRIQADARLRLAIHDFLDRRCPDFTGKPALALAHALKAHVHELMQQGAQFDLVRVDRGLSSKEGGFWAVAMLYPVELVLRMLRGLGVELRDWLAARRDPPQLYTPEIRQRLDEIGRHEDRLDQNGLTHLVPIKAGAFRMATLKFALRIAQEMGERGGRTGRLGELDTIHFARWVILDDGRLLFFSNYDGSWEAYLGDFIDRAWAGLTMIWSNTLHFPTTFGLFFLGARDEERFKRWTRAYQFPTQIWYSAYPSLSVAEVIGNAEIREILAQELTESSAARLCRLV